MPRAWKAAEAVSRAPDHRGSLEPLLPCGRLPFIWRPERPPHVISPAVAEWRRRLQTRAGCPQTLGGATPDATRGSRSRRVARHMLTAEPAVPRDLQRTARPAAPPPPLDCSTATWGPADDGFAPAPCGCCRRAAAERPTGRAIQRSHRVPPDASSCSRASAAGKPEPLAGVEWEATRPSCPKVKPTLRGEPAARLPASALAAGPTGSACRPPGLPSLPGPSRSSEPSRAIFALSPPTHNPCSGLPPPGICIQVHVRSAPPRPRDPVSFLGFTACRRPTARGTHHATPGESGASSRPSGFCRRHRSNRRGQPETRLTLTRQDGRALCVPLSSKPGPASGGRRSTPESGSTSSDVSGAGSSATG